MIVNEIFQSIEGEGRRAGELATFIRLCGCNLRCSYCDTAYAFDAKQGTEMSIAEIVREVNRISIGSNVTLTGGEPLIHSNVYDLIRELVWAGYEVNVETNGTRMPGIPSKAGSLFYTMDYKCPSSGEEDAMSIAAVKSLTEDDVLKFVVGSIEDLDKAVDVVRMTGTKAKVFLSPVFGKIEAKDIVAYMQRRMLSGYRIQLQMHKFIWDPSARGV